MNQTSDTSPSTMPPTGPRARAPRGAQAARSPRNRFARAIAGYAVVGFAILCLALLPASAFAPRAAWAAAPAGREMATVVGVGGSDKLLVQNDAGLTYRVQYIGVRGPVSSSSLNASAADFHGQIVLGQRVVLDSEGRDEDEGYKLRHVYLEGGGPLPLGGAVVAAGWAVAVPYPLEHRHRELYLQLEEQAMAQQSNLWQPGILGPAVAWRPAGSAEPGYVAADPDLHRYLDLLSTVPTGQSILSRLVRTVPTMLLRDMREGMGGATEPLGYHIELNRKATAADPHVLAVLIAHEGTHAVDFATGAIDLTAFSCFEQEQRAFGVEAVAWTEFFGPEGKQNPQDDFDRSENYVLSFARRGDIDNFVRRSSAYEAQCAGERITG